jgi:hypothetical protein
LKYAGLENAVVNLKELILFGTTSSLQIILLLLLHHLILLQKIRHFTQPEKTEIKECCISSKDEWTGQDITAAIGDMQMEATRSA